MVEETQFSIYNLRLLLSVSQCCHVQKGWPRGDRPHEPCQAKPESVSRLTKDLRVWLNMWGLLVHKQRSSKSLDLAHPNLLPSGSQSEVLQAISDTHQTWCWEFFGQGFGSVFGSLWNYARWDPFWAKELVILPAIWGPSWKAAKVGEREFEPENVGVETWKGFYG